MTLGLLGRKVGTARALADELALLNAAGERIAFARNTQVIDSIEFLAKHAQLNARDLKQLADADALAFPTEMIADCTIAFDVVQYPPETPFLRTAREAGKRCITGTEVATLQALQQFILYTGVTPTDAQVAEAAAFARG